MLEVKCTSLITNTRRKEMKNILSVSISIFLLSLFSNSAWSAGDEENIRKLSNFQKTGGGQG
jgi:hypothetical protein